MDNRDRYIVLKDLLIAEDRVFGDRMNIFLVVNSIMLVGFTRLELVGYVIPVLGIVLDIIWLYIGHLTLSSHNFWSDEMVLLEKELAGKSPTQEGIITKRRAFYPRLVKLTGLSSTGSLAYIVPVAFLVMWMSLIYIVMTHGPIPNGV